jgi:hypothetical protein
MATHLAASMRVVASIQHRRRVSIADARRAVLEAAQRVEDGIAGPDTLLLVERLEKVTGAGIVDLARLAANWS